MSWSLDAIFNVDRRVIFVFVFLAILLPMIWPFSPRVEPTRHVQSAYDQIEKSAARGGVVFLSWDFGPAVAPELEPAARAMIRHIFSRGGRVVISGGDQSGIGIHRRILAECAQEYGAVAGRDYVYLGYKPGGPQLIINMGQNFPSAFPTDADGNDITKLELTRNIARLGDFDYAVEYCAGLGTVTNVWLAYAQGLYNVKVGAAVTAVIAPDLNNYLDSGQLTGLLGGLVGAAQYESLVQANGGYLIRRFSSADLVPSQLPKLCRMLAEGRGELARAVWNSLTDEQRRHVQATGDGGGDQLRPTDKVAIAAALNELILSGGQGQGGTSPATAPDATQPAGGASPIPDSALPEVLARADKEVRDLLQSNRAVAARQSQILRRLHVEAEFGPCLGKAQSAGPAVRRMAPQSVAHIVLILAIIAGNIAYFVERFRGKKRTP